MREGIRLWTRRTARSILDVACGTAEHARHLAKQFEVTGIDLEPRFIEIAREKVPGARFEVADMRDFDLGGTFDVVQCLFSSIGYLTTDEDIVAALRYFRQHLNPGGLVLVEPWLMPETFEEGRIGMTTVERDDVKICRMNTSSRIERISRLHFHYLIARAGEIEHRTETHDLALVSVAEMIAYFGRAGLSARFDPGGPSGRGLYLARLA
jgi:SAM-dependent methyltransferase